MLGFMGVTSQKKSLENTIKNKLSSQEPIEIQFIKYFINTHIRTGKQLDQFLKIAKRMILTPHSIFKILMFIHAYLQSGRQFKEQTMISFMNFLLFHCTNFIQFKADKQNINSIKNTIIRTQMSTREEQISESKEILIHNTAKIYIRYLLKIISIYDDFNKISNVVNHETHFVWMMINLMKSVSSFTNNFILIGRYFIKQYGDLVISNIQMFTQDVIELTQSLKRYISHQNRVLSSSASSSADQIQQFVKMLTEINTLNQSLYQIYLGKYFFDQLEHIDHPKWINPNSTEFDTIFKVSQMNQKNQELSKLDNSLGSKSRKNLFANKK